MLTRLRKYYSNYEILKMVTSGNGELFPLSGDRNLYKEARVGVIRGSAWADMLLADGDPTKDINALNDYENNFAVIIKNGKIYKNTLH